MGPFTGSGRPEAETWHGNELHTCTGIQWLNETSIIRIRTEQMLAPVFHTVDSKKKKTLLISFVEIRMDLMTWKAMSPGAYDAFHIGRICTGERKKESAEEEEVDLQFNCKAAAEHVWVLVVVLLRIRRALESTRWTDMLTVQIAVSSKSQWVGDEKPKEKIMAREEGRIAASWVLWSVLSPDQ